MSGIDGSFIVYNNILYQKPNNITYFHLLHSLIPIFFFESEKQKYSDFQIIHNRLMPVVVLFRYSTEYS